MCWLPSTCRSTSPLTFMASTSSPAHVKLPAAPTTSCSSSENRDLFQLMTKGSRLVGGRGDLASLGAGNGESTMEGLVPSKVGAKRIAGVKDLPGGLSSAVWEVHRLEAPSFLWMQTHPPHSWAGRGGNQMRGQGPEWQCPPASAVPMGQGHCQDHCRTSLLGLITM